MPAFICTACGTQYPPAEAPPRHCRICTDDRQFIAPAGQSWTTLEPLAGGHFNCWHEHEPGVIGISTLPHFAIGQRALLLRTARGNVLWDTVALIDAATRTLITALGGLQAIAISHPHFYTTMIEWSRAFADAPIFVHEADREWIVRPDPAIRLWEGTTCPLLGDVTLVHCGGHFPGGAVLHWAAGAGGRGLLCSSDIAMVGADRRTLSFMHSYPNFVPLSAPQVTGIAASLEPFAFDAIYGIFFDRVIPTGGKSALASSVARYLHAVERSG
jgi:hypothetical protein